jgi:pSer/pThr/pTyr-binding forkhead associated (FHA) protein
MEVGNLALRHRPSALSRAKQVSSSVPTAPIQDNAHISSLPVFVGVEKQRVRLPLNGSPTEIGRNDNSPLKFENDLVSRRHAQLRAKDGGLEVMDLGSTNGTFLGNSRLEPNKWYRVGAEQELKLAGVSLDWSNEAEAQPPQKKLQANEPQLLQAGQKLSIAGVEIPVGAQEAQALNAAGAAVGGPIGAVLTLAGLKEFARKDSLESKSSLLSSIQSARAEQSKESGIVDLPKGVPTMVIPDIHAQRDYLTRALEHQVDGRPVLELLQEGKMNLLCLGDGMHGEGRAANRWLQAEQDFINGQPSKAMHDEMVESMGTMKMVMDLKSNLGDNFVYLRGNHDDINPEHGYLKYTRVGESNLVKDWVTKNYGQDLLEEWHGFERSMPLVARGQGFVASHAAPGGKLDAAEVKDKSTRAFYKLAWTENRGWSENGRERRLFEDNKREIGAQPDDRWLVGHRKVENADYRAQFDQQLIQINPLDSDGFVVAMIGADGSYDPQKDTFRV